MIARTLCEGYWHHTTLARRLSHHAPVRLKAFQDVLVRSNYDIEKTIKLESITRLYFSGGRSTPTKNR